MLSPTRIWLHNSSEKSEMKHTNRKYEVLPSEKSSIELGETCLVARSSEFVSTCQNFGEEN